MKSTTKIITYEEIAAQRASILSSLLSALQEKEDKEKEKTKKVLTESK